MTCRLSLIDPSKNKVTKELYVDGTYVQAEEKAVELNEKLNKKRNIKELFWKVTEINC